MKRNTMNEAVTLAKFAEWHRPTLLRYALPKEQMLFTALPEQVLKRITARNATGDHEAFPVTILYGELPVGMFVLDKGHDLSLWTDNPNAFLLRSLSIDPEFQRQGVGKQAMQLLPGFIEEAFRTAGINEIVLGVNIENEIAQRLYAQIGFIERGFNMNPPFVGQIIMKWNRW